MVKTTTEYSNLVFTHHGESSIKRTTAYQYTTKASFWAAFDEMHWEYEGNMNVWVKDLKIEIMDFIPIEEYRQMEEE